MPNTQYSKAANGAQMPHQSQGARMAIEDAAALSILFSLQYLQAT